MHARQFSHVLELQQPRNIKVPKDPFKREWTTLLPQSQYGLISLTSAKSDFIKQFKDSLVSGTFDEFSEQNINGEDYSKIYKMKGEAQSDTDRKLIENNSPQNLEQVKQKLSEFKRRVNRSSVPIEYKAEYDSIISKEELLYPELVKAFATPEFSIKQKSPEEWAGFIDVNASREAGTVMLPLEGLAREYLLRSRGKEERKRGRSLKSALDIWRFSDNEKQELGYDGINDDAKTLSAEKSAKLIGIILKRLQLNDWESKVDDSVTATTASAKERRVKVPKEREFDRGDVVYIPSHEPDHAVGNENGLRQEFGLLPYGVYEYLKTEEGKCAGKRDDYGTFNN